MGGAAVPQGAAMDLLEFRIARQASDSRRVPALLPAEPWPGLGGATRQRVFRFDSMMMSHAINGVEYDLERVDESGPFGSTEVWTFVNDSAFLHPVHVHAAHFRVFPRTGGRGQVFPWESGPKDTVLVDPGESVDVVTRFDRHRGLFVLHCHNLGYEDMGMMMNFAVE